SNVGRRNRAVSWHKGVDIFTTPTRSKVYTPIRLTSMRAFFNFGHLAHADKFRVEPYKTITRTTTVGASGSSTNEKIVMARDKIKFSIDPSSKGLGFLGKKKHLTVPTVETKHKGVVTTITTTHKRWVWYKEYEAWKAIGESSLIPNVGSTKRSGITLEGWGWVSPPNPISTSGKASKGTELRPLSCIVRYKHLSMILKGPKGTYGIGTRSVPAGVKPDRKPLGVIGSTGNAPTGGEHLHFEMAIETLGNKADKIYTNTVKAVLKARTEFLTNMLLLKMTKTGGQLKADPKAAASSQLSEAWKKKLRGKIKVKVDGKVTVIDVNKAKAIAFDVETTAPDAVNSDLVGISLAVKPGQGYYIPIGHNPD
ncbi:hypothetical protein LCGC14_2992390, partial [marine sediment metagenome]